ncbi:uncharacterized protein LOC113279965 [Papaver somniferum]|uniref:uncharacterized protein LOC113279965 n=1 Tax=Papaver somniferum TaxID=3469 RepID=UPI000E705604|nr:uncharacterized protein LOC113279965 [Papaver somniferum]
MEENQFLRILLSTINGGAQAVITTRTFLSTENKFLNEVIAASYGDLLYHKEFLNKIENAYMPPHELKLKIGLPIILLSGLTRNQDIVAGTRLIITELLEHEIVAEVLTVAAVGEEVVIGKSGMKSRDTVPLTRCQFSVKIAFAMHTDRCKAQILHSVGFYLEDDNPSYIGFSNTAKEPSKQKSLSSERMIYHMDTPKLLSSTQS